MADEKTYDDAKFRALLLTISHSMREHKPTLQEIKQLLTDARDEAQAFIGTKTEIYALEVMLDRLKQGDEYMATSTLAHIFWWYFLNPDEAVKASTAADKPKGTGN